MTEPEQWAVELWAEMYAAVYGCEPTHPAHMYGNAHRILQRAFEERTDQLIPAPSVDDAVVERVARAINHVRFEDDGSSPCQDDYDMATAAIRIITTPPTGTPFKLAGCKEQADG